MNKTLRDQVMSLTAQERAELAQELWDSVELDDDCTLTEEQLKELRRRVEEHRRNPDSAISWEVVRKELLSRFE